MLKENKVNMTLLDNIKIILSIPNIKLNDIDEELYSVDINNIKEFSDGIRALYKTVSDTEWIDPYIREELNELIEKVYKECFSIIDSEYLKYKDIIKEQRSCIIHVESESSYSHIKHFIKVNEKVTRRYRKFINHSRGYLIAILDLIDDKDPAFVIADGQEKVIDKIINMVPELISNIDDIKKRYKIISIFDMILCPIDKL